MARKFDRFMVANDNGHNLKLARFTDAEFRALVQGIWPIASEADPRGAFMVGKLPATAEDVAFKAPKVSIRTARAALEKMRALGMLEFDEELGGEWVHDWDQVNPAPKSDRTNAERQRRWRERNGARNGESNGARNGGRNCVVTPVVTPTEVEGEGEETANAVSSPASADDAPTARWSADVVRLCALQSRLARERTEEPARSRKLLPTETWHAEMDKLIRLDGRSPEAIERAIWWVHRHHFWGKNVLSVPKLREQFSALVAEARSRRTGVRNGGGTVSDAVAEMEARAAALRAQEDTIEGRLAA